MKLALEMYKDIKPRDISNIVYHNCMDHDDLISLSVTQQDHTLASSNPSNEASLEAK